MKRLFLFSLLIALAASPAAAMNVTVGCPGGAPGTYGSISAAVAALQPEQAHTIFVSGTCTENVGVHGFEDLRIIGTPAATILDPGALPNNPPIVFVVRSRVALENLTIGVVPPTSAYVPVVVGGGPTSSVELNRCTLQGGDFPGGLWVHPGSLAVLRSTVIQDNVNSGARVDAGARIVVSELFPGDAPSIIQRNTFAGIGLSDGATLTFRDGGNVIQNNNTGINTSGGHVFLCCDAGSKIVNNRIGIRANGGTVRVNSPFLFENNSVAAIFVTGANAILSGGQTYRNNGTSGDVTTGAVVAEGSSHVDLFDAEITENHGSGLVLRENSSARVFDDRIRNNEGSGVRVTALASVTSFGLNTIDGNGSYDLFCAPNSFGSGDATGIRKMFCPGFDQSPQPRGGNSPEP